MYNPNEARVQTGPHAGEWTGGDASTAIQKAASDKKGFSEAKTVEEAKQWAKDVNGFTNVQSSLNLEALNMVNKRIFELKGQYKADSLTSLIDENKTFYASADAVTMGLNPKFFNNPDKFLENLKKNETSGWLHKGQNLTATIDHEFAHVLTTNRLMASKVVREDMSEEIKKVKKDYSKELTSLYKQGKSANNSEFFISTYASKDIYEFTAESFSMALNAKNPSPYAIKVKNIIDKYLKK